MQISYWIFKIINKIFGCPQNQNPRFAIVRPPQNFYSRYVYDGNISLTKNSFTINSKKFVVVRIRTHGFCVSENRLITIRIQALLEWYPWNQFFSAEALDAGQEPSGIGIRAVARGGQGALTPRPGLATHIDLGNF